MSNFLAPATVTAVLRLFLEDEVTNDAGFGFDVHVGMPAQPAGGGSNNGRINIFLYQVVPNTAWRNTDLPTRSRGGQLLQRPRAALDLYYLLTFYGDESDLQPERLMGSAVKTLHARPALTTDQINAARTHADYPFLVASNLAGEIEQVKFCPLALNLEEMSKLWSVFFQQKYSLSLAYTASVVFVEPQTKPVEPGLPVQTRTVLALPQVPPATLTPDQISDLVLWLRSDAEVTYDAEGLSAWGDSSGLDNDAEQPAGPRRPSFVAHGIGQKPVLRFDGSDDRLSILNLNYSAALSEVTVFALARTRSAVSQVLLSFDDQRYWELSLSDGAPNGPRARWITSDTANQTDSLASSTSLNDGRWHVLCGRFQTSSSIDKQLFVDGVVSAEATAHAGNSLGSGSVTRFGYLGVGSAAASAGGSIDAGTFLDADLAEVIVFNRALADMERQQVESYLQGRYG